MNSELYLRWMVQADMPEVLEIEQLQFESPWFEENFIGVLRQRNIIGLAVDSVCEGQHPRAIERPDSSVLGFAVYALEKRCLDILNFAVHPSVERRGVGSAVIRKLQRKLSLGRREQIRCIVAESNLRAHLFLRAMGFQVREIIRRPFDGSDMDGYQFVYDVRSRANVSVRGRSVSVFK